MSWEVTPTSPNSMSVGVNIQQVTVLSLDSEKNSASCVDDFGYEVRVSLHPLRARRLPYIDEKWVIDRKFGGWSFVAPLTNYSPAINGNSLEEIVPSLLTALHGMGHVSISINQPDQPTAIAGVKSATVSWTAPTENGIPTTGYIITSDPDFITETVDESTFSTTISGLTAGTPYTFTVVAINALGSSPASDPSTPVTPTAS